MAKHEEKKKTGKWSRATHPNGSCGTDVGDNVLSTITDQDLNLITQREEQWMSDSLFWAYENTQFQKNLNY